MVGRHVKRKTVAEARPTTQMHKDELLNLLTDSEREVAARHRAKTTVRPIDKPIEVPEHTPLPVIEDATAPIEDEPFTIDTRELDARVFQKHALNLHKSGPIKAIGTAQVVPVLETPVEAPIATAAPITAPPVEVRPEPAAEALELVAPMHVRRIPLVAELLAIMLAVLLIAVR